jgi:hypothetical protein
MKILFSITVQPGVAPIGTAQLSVSEDHLVVAAGSPVTVTYTIGGAVSAMAMLPTGPITLTCDGQPHTFQFAPAISCAFSVSATDANGGIVKYASEIVVQMGLPATDPTVAYTKTAVQGGDLTAPATWGGSVPGINDNCYIPPGLNCTLNSRTFQVARLSVAGNLTQTGGALYTTDFVGLRGGSYTQQPASGVAVCIVLNRPQHANDVSNFYRVVQIQGGFTLRTRGSTLTPFAECAIEPKHGDVQLSLKSPVSGWSVGHKILLPDSRQQTRSAMTPPVLGCTEVAIVRGVSQDGLTVYLLQPLQYDHPGAWGEEPLWMAPLSAGSSTVTLSTPTKFLQVGDSITLFDPTTFNGPLAETIVVSAISANRTVLTLASPTAHQHYFAVTAKRYLWFAPHVANPMRTTGFISSG